MRSMRLPTNKIAIRATMRREVAVLKGSVQSSSLASWICHTKSRNHGLVQQKGFIELIRLTQRANPAAKIPEVKVVDFRDYIGQNEAGKLHSGSSGSYC